MVAPYYRSVAAAGLYIVAPANDFQSSLPLFWLISESEVPELRSWHEHAPRLQPFLTWLSILLALF